MTRVIWLLWFDGVVGGSVEMPYWKGIVTLLIINAPWYGAMAAKHGLTYIYTFFGYHNLEVIAYRH